MVGKDAFFEQQLEQPPQIVAADAPPKTLEEVRERARKRLLGLCAVYPACDGGPDKLCQREAYGGRIGFGGAGSGSSFAANYAALQRLQLRTRVVGDHFEPDTSTTFLGLKLSLPVMGASASGLGGWGNMGDEREMCFGAVTGCRQAGTLGWRGDTVHYTLEDNPGLDAIEREGGHGIPIFKPRAQDAIKKLIERAERAGVPAVGVDLDGCGSTNFARAGQPVYRKTVADLRELVQFTKLPFVAKGIMTVEDADACVGAGVRVLAVSNHGGRVLDGTPGVAEVLPAIAERFRRHATITADGGVRTGFDVLRLLALGAHAVLIGRDLIRAALGGGAFGVKLQLEQLRAALGRAMSLTGCPNIEAIGPQILQR
jgi:isopentenyl diphosphate isomerase/L-lactate dehydrogenase-like FMN-dependent dehydrogenase